jgi:hypothetical protein
VSPHVVVERDHAGIGTPSPQVTAQTVRVMAKHIADAQKDPLIERRAHALIDPDSTRQLCKVWWWVKHTVRFLHHDPQICQLLNECKGGEYQMLVSPPVLLRMKRPEGDCATFTMLVLALAKSLCYQVRIITLACDRNRPGEYSHVYGAAFLPNEKVWCALDASHGTSPGWEVPAYDVQRRTEWDLDGNMVSDQDFSKRTN